MDGVSSAAAMIENHVFDEIVIGDSASLSKTVTEQDVELFAMVSGDMFHPVIAHGMLGAGLISTVLATRLPGPGTTYLGQDLQFRHPVGIGDTVTATLTVTQKHPATGELVLDCRCTNQNGCLVITGTALVRGPTEKIREARIEPPDVRLSRHQQFRSLLAAAAGGVPLATAVAHPCDALSLAAAIEAAQAGLIVPILVGPAVKIRAAAAAAGLDIAACRLVDAPHSQAAAAAAVALVRAGEAAMLMKGSLHTDELLHAVVATETGLRTARRLSHVYLMDVPNYPRPLMITDAAVNIAPDLETKRDIIQNAIELAHVMGIAIPRVALLSAVEVINPKMRSTLDAAALCKMADRGQITGGLLDGPLGFDNAVSPQAAAEKGIVSPVAGLADILVVPDLEAGNMLAKQLSFLAGADAAGVVLGARVPIILTSRADAGRTRIASCAVAVLLARSRSARSAAAVG